MSPAMDAAWPWLLDLFGGRQSARSIHFICADALLAFIIVHLVMVRARRPDQRDRVDDHRPLPRAAGQGAKP